MDCNTRTKAVTSGTATYTLSSGFVDLLEVVLRNSSGTDLPQMSGEYLRIPNKDNSGQPSQYFDRQTTPTITLWSTPDMLHWFYYVRRIQDADSLVNTTDAPLEFYCMANGLAYYISMKKAPERIQILKVYEEEFQKAMSEDANRHL